MPRSLSETASAPFKAMLSHNRPRHIWLANAAASSNFVLLQSWWARYLKSSSPSPKRSTKDRSEFFLRSSLAYLAKENPLKMQLAVHTVRAEIHPPKREGSPRVAAVLTGNRGFDS